MHEETIRRAQQGDTAAFRALVEAYSPGAWRLARILLPSLPPASKLTPAPGELLWDHGTADAIAIVQRPTGNKPFTLCALVFDQTTITFNVAPFYCSTDSGQSWTRRPRTAVEWSNGKPAIFELPWLMLSDGTLLAWDVRTLSVFPGNNPSAAPAHVIGTIPTPLNPDKVPGGGASPIPGGAVLWQTHDPQTLYVATYYSPWAPQTRFRLTVCISEPSAMGSAILRTVPFCAHASWELLADLRDPCRERRDILASASAHYGTSPVGKAKEHRDGCWTPLV